MRIRLLAGLMIIALAAGSCFKPQESLIPEGNPGALYTVAAETAAVYLTQRGTDGTPQPATLTPGLDSTATPFPPTAALTGEDEDSEVPCDQVRFVRDLTIPDNQDLPPGESFTKTWRLENAGSCTWTIGYMLVFDKGDALGAPASLQLTNRPVLPGGTIDVSVEMTAPEEVGSYQGYWKIRNVKGDTFGLGEYNQPFWVKINVVKGGGTMFDFNARAEEAAWGAGKTPVEYQNIGEKIVYFGQESDPEDPQVRLEENLPLEGGRSSGILIYTSPAPGAGNYLTGRFPEYTVNRDDLLFGRVGLAENPGGNCGTGNATFQLELMIVDDPSSLTTLWEGEEVCDGQMQSFEIGLNSYRGKSVHFFLTVIANTASTENDAVWDSFSVHR